MRERCTAKSDRVLVISPAGQRCKNAIALRCCKADRVARRVLQIASDPTGTGDLLCFTRFAIASSQTGTGDRESASSHENDL
jgi:hypothetical protein